VSLSGADGIRSHVTKCYLTLEEAEALFSAGFTNGAVNRIYYACFYAVSALLHTEGYSSSKHSGVMSLFNRHWIAPELLPREMGKFYRTLFDERQQGDYTTVRDFEPVEVKAWLGEARSFVDQIKAWISEHKGLDLS
jgi:uncharacterized protein